MKREKRKFSPEEKLSILQEVEREGQTQTCRKYSISPTLYANRKGKYLSRGVSDLNALYKRVDPERRALE